MSIIRVPVNYYQQFDANLTLDVPGEGYGGWKKAEIELDLSHTALVVMHAWDHGQPEDYPGWHRAVEYIPRSKDICKNIFPDLLSTVRASDMKLFHVVGGGDYYKDYPGYKKAVELAGEPPSAPEIISSDPTLDKLWQFRAENVFVGRHNEADVERGFLNLDFPPEAEPLGDEPIAENASQLFAVCKDTGVNHLIYAGFAINWCLLLSPGGMADMSKHGIMCSTIREAVTAVENKESARTQLCKELALWRTALAFGFVFNLNDLLNVIRNE